MTTFLSFDQLSPEQIEQYRQGVSEAFPDIILASPTSKKYWNRLESYFPQFQRFLLSDTSEIIAFINSIPFYYDQAHENLSDDGWDWMLAKGIHDYEDGIKANYLGGLQIIVRKEYLGMGFSREILRHAKQVFKKVSFQNLLIPIRPTKKFEHPDMSMDAYMQLKADQKVYDPWIRTHVKSGAEIIKICHNSMNIQGDIPFWEDILKQKISSSGNYLPHGALNPIRIDIDQNKGEYREPNIWLKYD